MVASTVVVISATVVAATEVDESVEETVLITVVDWFTVVVLKLLQETFQRTRNTSAVN